MAKSASFVLIPVKVPKEWRGKLPNFGLDTDIPDDWFDDERQVILDEVPAVDKVLRRGTPVQWKLLERLVQAAPRKRVAFGDVSVVKRFFAKTKAITSEREPTVDDKTLAAMWREAAGAKPTATATAKTKAKAKAKRR